MFSQRQVTINVLGIFINKAYPRNPEKLLMIIEGLERAIYPTNRDSKRVVTRGRYGPRPCPVKFAGICKNFGRLRPRFPGPERSCNNETKFVKASKYGTSVKPITEN